MNALRMLIDTNVFIPLEGEEETRTEAPAAELVRFAQQHECTVFTHPASIEDLTRDKDNRRRQRNLRKLQKYPLLSSSPEPDRAFTGAIQLSEATAQDKVDNALLYAVKRDCVALLVTEDAGIHRKAARCGLADRVYGLEEALEALRQRFAPPYRLPPAVRKVPVYAIAADEPILDDLRLTYPDFDPWLSRIKKEGREAWACQQGEKGIIAICIYKEEDTPYPELRGKMLKLCTFTVRQDARGRKLGELLLKAVFEYVRAKRFPSAYVELFEEKSPPLVLLLEDFGFRKLPAHTSRGEAVYAKRFAPDEAAVQFSPLDYHIRFGPPAVKVEGTRGYLVPIRPHYHELLFPDAQAQQDLFPGESPCGNAIRKAYICNAATRKPQPGDLLFFYRTHDQRAVTTIGVLENASESTDPEVVWALVAKRTVFAFSEIERLCERGAYVLLFRQVGHVRDKCGFNELKELGAVRGPVQSITEIPASGMQELVGRLP